MAGQAVWGDGGTLQFDVEDSLDDTTRLASTATASLVKDKG